MLNYWILYGSCMACKSAIKSQGCAVIYHRFQWHISLPLRLCNSLRRPYSVMIVTSALELVSSQLINTALLFFFLIDVGVSSHNDLCTGQSSRVPLVVTSLKVHVNSSIVTWTDKLAFRIGGATPTFLQIG